MIAWLIGVVVLVMALWLVMQVVRVAVLVIAYVVTMAMAGVLLVALGIVGFVKALLDLRRAPPPAVPRRFVDLTWNKRRRRWE